MLAKEMAKKVIDALPDESSFDDVIHALYIRSKFERGEREIREGRGVSHEDAKQQFAQWHR